MDRSFIEQNRASTERIRRLVSELSDKQLQHSVGEHWTVAVALAHLAFLGSARFIHFRQDGTRGEIICFELDAFELDVITNDISLPFLVCYSSAQSCTSCDRDRRKGQQKTGRIFSEPFGGNL